ncbi:unnamed protein product [Ectocarpus sp. 6 AP-2014]
MKTDMHEAKTGVSGTSLNNHNQWQAHVQPIQKHSKKGTPRRINKPEEAILAPRASSKRDRIRSSATNYTRALATACAGPMNINILHKQEKRTPHEVTTQYHMRLFTSTCANNVRVPTQTNHAKTAQQNYHRQRRDDDA